MCRRLATRESCGIGVCLFVHDPQKYFFEWKKLYESCCLGLCCLSLVTTTIVYGIYTMRTLGPVANPHQWEGVHLDGSSCVVGIGEIATCFIQ